MMNQYIIPIPHNDPRLFSHVSQAFSLVDLGKRLLDAAKNGDVEEVKSLMNNGAPFTTDWLGISPLHFAAMNGHLSSCEALLRAGISRDARTKVDRTPLHLAAQEGHADIVELLLRNGADISAKDMLRMTALHWAAERGHAHVVQMLMRFGANAHLQNKFEMTPLDIAESKGHMDARDAMLNTQYDMVSSVGRMAATNVDLVNANAYILTDEETLVPAAPPADEVTVTTATTIEDISGDKTNATETDTEDARRMEEGTNGSHSDPILTGEVGGATKATLVWPQDNTPVGDTNSPPLNAIDRLNGHTDLAKSLQDPARQSVNGSAESLLNEKRIKRDTTNTERDVMLVETPDGERLFVKQRENQSGPESLSIYTSSGDRVDNPPLLAQVVRAMEEMPQCDEVSECSPQHSDTNGADVDLSLPVRYPSTSNRNGLDSNEHQRGSGSVPTDGSSRNHERVRPRAFVRVASPDECTSTPNGDQGEDLDFEDVNSLPAQLAGFINDPSCRLSSICVEGVELNATLQDLCNWCLYNGIFVRSFASDTRFAVEFIYDNVSYTLGAVYDPDLGTVTFHTMSSPTK